MSPQRFLRINGSLARNPLTGFWALGSLAGTLNPTIPNLPLLPASGGAVSGTAVSTVSAGSAVATGEERFTGVAQSQVSGGAVVAAGGESFIGAATSTVSGGSASGEGDVSSAVTGSAASTVYAGVASGEGSVSHDAQIDPGAKSKPWLYPVPGEVGALEVAAQRKQAGVEKRRATAAKRVMAERAEREDDDEDAIWLMVA